LAAVATKGDLAVAIGIMTPFLIWDAVKAVIAAALLPLAWAGIKKLDR
jgi:biotin transport system substrate-specific component